MIMTVLEKARDDEENKWTGSYHRMHSRRRFNAEREGYRAFDDRQDSVFLEDALTRLGQIHTGSIGSVAVWSSQIRGEVPPYRQRRWSVVGGWASRWCQTCQRVA
jgi:hypothetical protein